MIVIAGSMIVLKQIAELKLLAEKYNELAKKLARYIINYHVKRKAPESYMAEEARAALEGDGE